MNRMRLLLAYIVVSQTLVGQVYKPLLEEPNEWHITSCSNGCLTDIYYTVDDTVVSGLNYKILDGYHFISRTFLLRENTVEKKVYLMLIRNGRPQSENLLYDFSLNTGDSIDIKNPISPFPNNAGYFKVDSIVPRPLLNGKDYRYFYLSALDTVQASSRGAIWIEGIGSLSLINSPGGKPDINGVGKLTCFFKNNRLIYSDLDSIPECNSNLSLSTDQAPIKNKISVYPTFTSSNCFVKASTNIKEIAVFNVSGLMLNHIKIKGKKTVSFNTEVLPPGILVLKIILADSSEHRFKIINQ